MNNGTPGAQNSAYVSNMGPTLNGMQHDPAVPDATEAVTVSILAADPQGVSSMICYYSVVGGSWQQTTMTDDGAGRYSAILPGQSSADIVQFYVAATDGAGYLWASLNPWARW